MPRLKKVSGHMMQRSLKNPRCYIPRFVEIDSLVLEMTIFEGFLSYRVKPEP